MANELNASVEIWNAQTEVSDFGPTDYIPTTSAAVSVGPTANVPRLNYSNGCPSLLLEPQRTNLALWSEAFDNAGWGKTGGTTITENDTISPDGYQNADRFNMTSNDTVAQGVSVSGEHTFSVWLKGTAGETIGIGCLVASGTFVEEQKTLTTDWQRYTLTATFASTGTRQIYLSTYAGATARTLWAWGAQLEASSYASSYIGPTLGASVTRLADAAYKTGISSLLSASEYTLFWEGSHIPSGQYNSFATFYNSANQNLSARFYRNNTNNELRAAAFNNAVGLSVDIGSGVTTQAVKCAFRVKAGDFALFVNGTLVGTNTNSNAPASTLDSVNLQYFNAGQSYDQKTGQVLFFKTGLTNAQLAELTTL